MELWACEPLADFHFAQARRRLDEAKAAEESAGRLDTEQAQKQQRQKASADQLRLQLGEMQAKVGCYLWVSVALVMAASIVTGLAISCQRGGS